MNDDIRFDITSIYLLSFIHLVKYVAIILKVNIKAREITL